MNTQEYYIYVLTNLTKRVLYVGVTNNLPQRVAEHYIERGSTKSFTGRYHCYYLIYFEKTRYVDIAIKREKQLKGWTRKKKLELIYTTNPHLNFLNNEIMEWPPGDDFVSRKDK
ncbi:MAG TPA: GIY-YIG nuclease family protein [Ferruginibacter sp.]|jgi:putative endonuclease|nr:GIY-YIG nuclease family protein [Ferruginibacter sp.]